MSVCTQLAPGAIVSSVGGASGGAVDNYAGLGDSPIVNLVFATGKNEAQVIFSEPILDNPAVRNISNYVWDGGLSTISVKDVSANVVTLETSDQTEGFLYNLTVRGIFAVVISDKIVATDQSTGAPVVAENVVYGSGGENVVHGSGGGSVTYGSPS